jgi:hypothetical protein
MRPSFKLHRLAHFRPQTLTECLFNGPCACSYDYGSTYIEENLGGVCLCGAPACKYKPQQAQEQQ